MLITISRLYPRLIRFQSLSFPVRIHRAIKSRYFFWSQVLRLRAPGSGLSFALIYFCICSSSRYVFLLLYFDAFSASLYRSFPSRMLTTTSRLYPRLIRFQSLSFPVRIHRAIKSRYFFWSQVLRLRAPGSGLSFALIYFCICSSSRYVFLLLYFDAFSASLYRSFPSRMLTTTSRLYPRVIRY
ncbi:hypothetical protein B0H10DRAFT_523530 [Mycena sp. CBHHK59/15]|nr:hypothetical protein B0H10DRAFT_523530 [Mycena sp. CBHHK59/15]